MKNKGGRPLGIPQIKGNTAKYRDWLVRAIGKSGMTCAELSRASGVHIKNIYHYTAGDVMPNMYTHIKLCKVMGADLAEGLEELWDGGKFESYTVKKDN